MIAVRCLCTLPLAWLLTGLAGAAEETALPPYHKEPILRVEAGGSTAFVTSLAFSPDGKKLYAGGFDKVVRVWNLDGEDRFVPSTTAYRVPIGPGIAGSINALALSSDGKWLAVAGWGMFRKAPGFGMPGVMAGKVLLSEDDWLDIGAIYVFDTETRKVHRLRGHRGYVLSLAFAPTRPGKSPVLASVGQERDGLGHAGTVRLWDIKKGPDAVQIGVLPKLPDPDATRPGVAVWHTGDQPKQVRVALSWPVKDTNKPGTLYLWDGARDGGQLWHAEAGRWNLPLAFLPDSAHEGQGTLVTSFYGEQPNSNEPRNRGHLQSWKVAAEEQATFGKMQPLPMADGHDYFLPRALAAFSSPAPNSRNYVAAILEVPDKAKNSRGYMLQLFSGDSLQPLGKALPLWIGPHKLPVAAADTTGRFLAVAGNIDNEIAIFSVSDLISKKEQASPRQTLRSIGATVQYVALGRKGQDRGLFLNERRTLDPSQPPRDPDAKDLLFDFKARRLVPYEAGWELDAPALGGWQLRLERDDKSDMVRHVVIRRDRDEIKRLSFSPEQYVTACALLPPIQPSPFQTPIVAIAYREAGESVLNLYNGVTGETVRRLTGHVDDVYSLAFSGDGKLLASAGHDQTVCVWSLTDLDRILEQQGGILRGVAIKRKEGGGLTLAHVETENLTKENRQELTAKEIAKGDTLEEIVVQEKRRRPASAPDYYDALWQCKPGTRVTLHFRGRAPATLVLSQGSDERKPLFSLFLSRSGGASQRRWIGWSPVGPYDSNAAEAERFIGWHRNTGEAGRPTEFVSAAEYRRDDFKPDILAYLIAKGSAGQALEAWDKDHPPPPPREPQMGMWIQELGREPPVDGRGRVRVRQRQATLRLAVFDELPPGKITSVEWDAEGLGKGPFTKTGHREWSADLSKLAWKRGEYRFTAKMRVEAGTGHVFQPKALALAYLPLPPVITLEGERFRIVDKEAFTFQAKIQPGATGEALKVVLLHQHENKDVAHQEVEADTLPLVKKELKLKPGYNLIKLIAVNKNAPKDQEEAEKAWVAVHVHYTKASPPRIALKSVVTLPVGTEIGIEPSKTVVVDAPRFRVVGEIEATEALVRAELIQGEDNKPSPLTGFVARHAKKWSISQEVTIRESEKTQKLRIVAKTDSSDVADRTLFVVYHPRLPQVTLLTPIDGAAFRASKEGNKIRLEAQLRWPPDKRPCQAEILLDNKPLGKHPVEAGADKFTAELVLHPGANEIQVRLSNPNRDAVSEKIRVNYLRPPRVVRVEEAAKKDKNVLLTDLRAIVESPASLPLTGARLNGVELPAAIFGQPVLQGELATYTFQIPDRGLVVGKNRFDLVVSNADGDSEPSLLSINVDKAKLPLPVVRMIDPAEDKSWTQPVYKAVFRVTSSTPLQWVELRRGQQVLHPMSAKDKPAKNQAGEYEITLAEDVKLERGPNSLKIVAANCGGEQSSQEVVINYHPEPVRVVFDLIETKNEKIALHEERDGCQTAARKLPQGRVLLHGKVLWNAESDAAVVGIDTLSVYVNGRQQLPVSLEKPSPGVRERKFKKEVLLTRAENNEVVIKLPSEAGIPAEADSHRQCRLHCLKPEPESQRRLHLLIVDAVEDDETQARQSVFRALQAQAVDNSTEKFAMPGFASGRLHGVLAGRDADRNKILAQLYGLRLELETDALSGMSNDVVMIYYHGWESPDARDHFLEGETGRHRISFQEFTDLLNRNLGAQILLLDVLRKPPKVFTPAEAQDQVGRWHYDPHLSMLRFSWRGQPKGQDPNARLLSELEEALRKARRFKDVTGQIENRFSKADRLPWHSLRYSTRLTYDRHVPAGQEDLSLGSGKSD
jgi:WD40 repeat protein